MQNSLSQQTQEFLSKATELGLIDEINERLEERNIERRAQLIAEMKALPSEANAGLPQLGKASARTLERLEKAKLELAAAQAAYNDAAIQQYGAGLKFNGLRAKLEAEIKNLAPQFIQDAHQDLDYLHGHIRHAVKVTFSSRMTFFGRQVTEETNADQVLALMTDIRAAQQQLEAMVLEVFDPAKAREEVNATCLVLQNRCFALGLDQQEFKARRIHQARAEEERQKRSAERRQILQTLGV